jgi:general secretion pathway protein F
MPIFEYRGMNQSGKNLRGTIDAENLRMARSRLKKDGIFVVDLKDKGKEKLKNKKKSGTGKKISIDELSMATRQLATLIKAKIPLVESLAAVSDQVENETLKEAVADIKNMVNEGAPFYKSLAKYPKLFDHIYVTMCEAGEATGNLDTILIRLAEFKEAQNELNSKVKSAILYPLIMFIFTLAMLSVIFIFVIPKLTSIFESAEMQLPWYTLTVIAFSNILVNYWWLILLIMGLAYTSFNSWKNSENGAKSYDALLLKLPVIGRLVRLVAVSRFTRTLATLLQGGVPMLSAMDIVSNVVGNHVLAVAIIQARDNISEGESIAGPLKKSEQFPPIVTHMINIGEKTGELENMLTQVSDSYDFQVKTQIQGLTALLEPVMIIMMGLVIGVIVFSIMLPMFEMSDISGGGG